MARDGVFRAILCAFGGLTILVLGSIALFLLLGAWPTVRDTAFSFVTNAGWNPVTGQFGALAVVYGTLVSSLIAVLIAAPLGIGAALFLQEVAPRRLSVVAGFLIEMLAAVPSVIFGLWGFFILAPVVRESIAPMLDPIGTVIPIFKGPSYGVGMLTAGLILALMILPTIAAIAREIFSAIPQHQREAALGLGATPWETIRVAVLAPSTVGLIGAVVLGSARAIGETMAVTMVIGNRNAIAATIFQPGQSMASLIASEYAEASDARHISALMAVGLLLLLISLSVNTMARLIARRSVRKWR